MVYSIIFAGGTGKRMHSEDIPKQFLTVDGKPIIIHTLEHFSDNDEINNIVVVCLASWIETLKKQISKFGIKKVSQILPGGETGFQSIHIGLEEISKSALDEDIVLICDGVRPILSDELINRCIEETRMYGTAVPVTPSIDSVLFSEDGKECNQRLERKKIFITQAPQGYKMKKIMAAHTAAEESGIEPISSADLLIELGETVHLIEGIRENIKVTTQEDLHSLRATEYYEHFLNFAKEEL